MTATRFSPPAGGGAAAPARGGSRSLIPDIGIPVGSYYLLRAAGFDVVTALALSSVFPAAQSAVALAGGRAVSGMAVLVLVVNWPACRALPASPMGKRGIQFTVSGSWA